MKITDILCSKKISVSCELFPPKKTAPISNIDSIVQKTAALSPSFISVTCGAGGAGGGDTADIADLVQNKNGISALAHLTCVRLGERELTQTLNRLRSLGIQNILALRGDLPKDSAERSAQAQSARFASSLEFQKSACFPHASELAEKIHDYSADFCIGGAAYPEGHPESRTLDEDIFYLRRKVESGCCFLTTQMFFDNNILYNFMFRLLKNRVDVPVIAGIMPVTNAAQITRICSLSGTALPPRFRAIVDRFAHDPASMRQAGIAYATEQIIDLVANGINAVHIYTMNNPEIAGGIFSNISNIIKEA